MTTKIILGPPGTGKTTTLLNILDQHLQAGVHPNKVGFISFTRKAAYEARDRAITRFDFLEEEVPYFRTIHSLMFRQLGLSHNQLMQKENYIEIANKLGIELSSCPVDPREGAFAGTVAGDRYLFIEGLSRVRGVPLRQQWEEINDDGVDWYELKQIAESLRNYKRQYMLYDFTDLLTRGYEEAALPLLDVLFVDECQDLAPVQWRIVERLSAQSDVTYLAGDDDQAIFTWSGADVNHFIQLGNAGDGRDVLVLDQSYRIPAAVHDLSDQIISNISNRQAKVFKSRDAQGHISYYGGTDEVDLSSGKWLCLARSRRQLKDFERICQMEGYHYAMFENSPSLSSEYRAIQTYQALVSGSEVRVDHARNMLSFCSESKAKILSKVDDESTVSLSWLVANANFRFKEALGWEGNLDRISFDDESYFSMAIKRGEHLYEDPRIKISTIHGVKGGQGDNVCIVSDIYSKVYDAMQYDPDPEHRVFYVGVTRTKEHLHIIQPRTPRSYPL